MKIGKIKGGNMKKEKKSQKKNDDMGKYPKSLSDEEMFSIAQRLAKDTFKFIADRTEELIPDATDIEKGGEVYRIPIRD